jgi:hypothetical protein
MPVIFIDISVMQLTVTPFILVICAWSRIQTFDLSVHAVQDYFHLEWKGTEYYLTHLK